MISLIEDDGSMKRTLLLSKISSDMVRFLFPGVATSGSSDSWSERDRSITSSTSGVGEDIWRFLEDWCFFEDLRSFIDRRLWRGDEDEDDEDSSPT